MEIINIAELLNAGIHGLLVIVLLIAWYERREMRADQLALIKLLLEINPQAAQKVNGKLKRKIEHVKSDT